MPYATGSAGLATLVRGSSRRIKIMRFRPANIRLINRRSNLPRLLLALSSKNDKGNNKNNPIRCAGVDRVTPYQGLCCPPLLSGGSAWLGGTPRTVERATN